MGAFFGAFGFSVVLFLLEGNGVQNEFVFLFHVPGGFYLPAEGAGAEHGGLAAVERGDEQLGLALEDVQRVFLVGLAQRVHEVVARLGQSAEEDEGLRRVEGGEVGAGRAENLSRELEDFEGDGVSGFGGLEHVERRDFFGVERAEPALGVAPL